MMQDNLFDELFAVDFFDPFFEMRHVFTTVQKDLQALYDEQNLLFADIERILEQETPGLRRRLEELWRLLDGDICARRQTKKLSAEEIRRWRNRLAAWQTAWRRAIDVCRLFVLKAQQVQEAACQVDYSAAA